MSDQLFVLELRHPSGKVELCQPGLNEPCATAAVDFRQRLEAKLSPPAERVRIRALPIRWTLAEATEPAEV